MSLKLVAACAVGILTPIAASPLPAPWGVVLQAVVTGLAYLANHDAIAAAVKRS